MDSTTVSMITNAATQLGFRAGDLYALYLGAGVLTNLIWAVTFATVALKIASFVAQGTEGYRILDQIADLAGSNRAYASDRARAIRILTENWHTKRT